MDQDAGRGDENAAHTVSCKCAKSRLCAFGSSDEGGRELRYDTLPQRRGVYAERCTPVAGYKWRQVRGSVFPRLLKATGILRYLRAERLERVRGYYADMAVLPLVRFQICGGEVLAGTCSVVLEWNG
jgi:hypothetical protein